MNIKIETCFTEQQKDSVLRLWNEEYPQKLQYSSVSEFDHYLDGLADKKYFFLVDDQEDIRGWAASFIRDQERWFAILLSGTLQGQGFGTMLLNEIKKAESHLFGWVIDENKELKANGELYQSPLYFYKKNDFIIQTDIRLESEKMSAVRIEWTKQ